MVSTVINLVVNFIKEHYPTLRIRDGFIWDLYVKAFALLFNEEIDKLQATFNRLDIRRYASMPESDLDRLASYYFLTRNNGNRASAIVTIELGSAIAVKIIGGSTAFGTADGLRFFASRDMSFSASQIASNPHGNNFLITVPVTAETASDQYNVGTGAINSLQSSIGQVSILAVRNNAPATSGANKETNTQLFMRIVRAINTRGLLITRASVASVVLDNFPTVRGATVVGKGDAEMQRDRVYPIMVPGGYSPYKRSDFNGKKAAVIRNNKNIAYAGRLEDVTIPNIPSPDELEEDLAEFSQAEYYTLIAMDLEYSLTRGALEMFDDFELPPGTSLNSKVQDIAGWIATDSGSAFGTRLFGSSATVFNGNLCLGATLDDLKPYDPRKAYTNV